MSTVLFLDTNVMLDLLAKRMPYHDDALQLASLADRKKVRLLCSALSFANAGYMLKKSDGADRALEKLRMFKILCGIAPMSEDCVEKALQSNFSDFEDALQYFSALEAGATLIISRDSKGFKNAAIPVLTAEEFLKSRLLNP